MLKKLQLTLLLGVFVSAYAFAQSRTIEGFVTDAGTGEAIAAASVQVKGTTRGTSTGIDGSYSIQASTGDVLIFSFIGFISQEITVGNQTLINIELEEDVALLDEVVITGYTVESRDKFTGSISTISNNAIESVPVASFDQILQGKSPGLFVTSGSGQPGTASTVRIRGTASIVGGNAPLYVVDGVPINGADFASLNPGDFESVNVLKDASATAIYGSRGSNGVIVVTTKRGRSGQSQITYRGQYGVSTVGDARFEMMNSEQKLDFEEFLQTGQGWALSPDNAANAGQDPADLAAARQDLIANGQGDWSDVFFRNGITQTHELSFAGGNERTRYFVSGNLFDQEGIGLRSQLERYTLRVNLDVTANDNIDLGFTGQGGYSESSFVESENGIALANPFAAVYLANPYDRLRNDDGSIAVGVGQTGANAFDRLEKDENRRNELKFVGKVFINYNIKNFRIGTDFAMDYRERDFDRWINPNSFAGGNVQNGGAGLLSKRNNRRTIVTSLTSAEYTNTFEEKHAVNFFVANEFIGTYFDRFNYTGYGLNPKLGATPASITPGTPTNNMIPVVDGVITENALWSVFGIANYSYDDKYNLKASLRRDGSSRFGEDNQFAINWSVGASWLITNEDFLQDQSFLNRLLIRSSYGTTGNQFGIGDFERLPTYQSGSFVGNQTIVPNTIGNAGLKWEQSSKFNVGFDYTILDERISGTVDIYNELTSDLFIEQQLSRTSGFTELEINAGNLRNRGIELSINADVYRTSDALISLNANYAYNDNEVTDLGQVEEFETGTSIIRKGLPIGSHYVVGWAGVDPATGAPLYYDLDGNVTPVFSSGNATANHGTSVPPKVGGFGLDASYKNFSIRSQFTFALDYIRFNNQSFFQENHGFSQFNLYTTMLDIWKQPGDITDIQSNQFPRQFSSKDLEDASYLRFRNLLVSYNVPSSVFDGAIRGIRIFAQAQNLYTWTKFTGFDPEDDNNIAGYEYPTPRIFTTGIDINF